jgi:two-component sensor histidine kinase
MNYSVSRKITQLEYQKLYNEKTILDSIVTIKKIAAQNFIHEKERSHQNIVLTATISLTVIILISLIFFVLHYFSNKKKNKLLNEKRKLIEKQKISMENTLRQKEVLLKEIHHRVKNNLQIISGLLELQYSSLEDKKQGIALREGQARVKSMALIHQKLYQTEDLAFVNLKDYIDELINYLKGVFYSTKSLKIKLQIEEINLDIDTAIPLGLILNEMISNSFKYAVKSTEDLIITINVSQIRPGEYQLTLTDNGPGMPEGFDFSNSTSLGLNLIKRLSQQLFGSFIYKNNDGLTSILTFKDTDLRKEVD